MQCIIQSDQIKWRILISKTKYEITVTIPLVVVLPPLSVSNRTENFYLASSVSLVTKRKY
jgi:hypothetical protein